MLLLITASLDGTADLIVQKWPAKVFRLNFDLALDYKVQFFGDSWRLEDPTGRWISSETVSVCFWWKAFSYFIKEQEPFVIEEIKYIFREIYNWCVREGMTRGNPPDFHKRLGKLNILQIAKRFLTIPETLATINLAGLDQFKAQKVVAKAFTSGLTVTNKTLFTTEVDPNSLHPKFPWYLQELVLSPADLTVFLCGSELFPYVRDRSSLRGLDWRAEQSFSPDEVEWSRTSLDPSAETGIFKFCAALGVDWGRLDFMVVDSNLIFLEFNANGQWVFLEPEGSGFLVEKVVDYLISSEVRPNLL